MWRTHCKFENISAKKISPWWQNIVVDIVWLFCASCCFFRPWPMPFVSIRLLRYSYWTTTRSVMKVWRHRGTIDNYGWQGSCTLYRHPDWICLCKFTICPNFGWNMWKPLTLIFSGFICISRSVRAIIFVSVFSCYFDVVNYGCYIQISKKLSRQ